MKFIYFHNKKDWIDYFPSIDEPIYEEQLFMNLTFSIEQKLSPQNGKAYVYNCYFHDMTNDYGAAIYYAEYESYILIEKCSFLKCCAANYQGALRIIGGNSILTFICAQQCSAGLNNGFCSVHDDINRKINYFLDSSIANCKSSQEHIITHNFGYIQFKSLNISNNKSKRQCGIHSTPNVFNETTKLGTLVIFCSFFNNTAYNEFCIVLQNTKNDICKHQIKSSNIISNNASNTLYFQGETEIIDSCLYNNGNPLFKVINSKLYLVSSSLDNMNKTGTGEISQTGERYSFIALLSFIETGECVNHLHNIIDLKSTCYDTYLFKFMQKYIFVLFLSSL